MASEERSFNLNIRVSDREREMLADLAEREGISSSDWMRRTIRMSYAKAFGGAAITKPKQRKKR